MLRSSIKSSIVSSLVTNLLGKEKSGFTRPSDWPEIRYNAPANSIVLLVGTTSSYGSAGTYDNFKFTATATGGYNVYIDNTLYGTYASAANCAIVWSTYNATSGQAVTTPSALTAHIIKIVPVTSGNTITAFRCLRTAASGIEEQGVLWAHFNLSNQIDLSYGFGYYTYYANKLMQAVTAKNNVLKVSGITNFCCYCNSLIFVPVINGNGNSMSLPFIFAYANLLRYVMIKNITITDLRDSFMFDYVITKVSFVNCSFPSSYPADYSFMNCKKLSALPLIDYTKVTSLSSSFAGCYIMTGILDLSSNSVFTGNIGCDNAYKLSGLILNPLGPSMGNIYLNFCNLDHTALVTLFNSMPTVTSSTCTITGCPGTATLTAEEKAIATGKGWTLVL